MAVYASRLNQCLPHTVAITDRSKSEIIKTKPIRKGLNTFHDFFNLVYRDSGIPGNIDSLNQIGNKGKSIVLLKNISN